MGKSILVLVTCAPLCVAACAHAPNPYSFASRAPAPRAIEGAETFLAKAGPPVASSTPTTITTSWRELGRELEVVGTNGGAEEPVSVRIRYVIEVQPRDAGSEVIVRPEHETCPVTMPLDITSQPLQSCLHTWMVTPQLQHADDHFGDRVRQALSGLDN